MSTTDPSYVGPKPTNGPNPPRISKGPEPPRVYKEEISSPPAFFLGTFGYSGSPKPPESTFCTLASSVGTSQQKPTMVNQDEEGVPYTDHSGDEQRQNQQQNQQQVDLDVNATANGSQESADRNAETSGTQNGQPNSGGDNSGGRRSTSTFDRLGPGNPDPRPFGGIGSDDT
ncbi:hypothetical protein PIB30_024697 [Stylosanthes scabra]|uniref:Microtubule-associated protein Jupiter n=1 Tax=Stylosanthes scabra TaxID=79078 RepID=A0ABU6QA33_9FABA|nr:hypothetical protein [Stylosanthes scabra]